MHHLKKNQKVMKKITKNTVMLKNQQKVEKGNFKMLVAKRRKKWKLAGLLNVPNVVENSEH